MIQTSILKPGYLVSLRTEISGGITYTRRDIKTGKTEAQIVAAAEKAGKPVPVIRSWETTKRIDDVDDWNSACFARSRCRSLITGICCATSFGLLCPEDRFAELEAAVAEARQTAADHNATAKGTLVGVYVLTGRIASTDEESARAIASEVQELLSAMNGAIDRLDVDAIRKAATKAASVSAMLSDDKARLVTGAVEAARKAAKTIVKRVEKDGEKAAKVLASIRREDLEKARFAFLDLGKEDEALPESSPGVDLQRSAELEIDMNDDGPASGVSASDNQTSDSPALVVVG